MVSMKSMAGLEVSSFWAKAWKIHPPQGDGSEYLRGKGGECRTDCTLSLHRIGPSWVGELTAADWVVCVPGHSFLKAQVEDPTGLHLDLDAKNLRCGL